MEEDKLTTVEEDSSKESAPAAPTARPKSTDAPVAPKVKRGIRHLPVKVISYTALLMALSVVANVFTFYFGFAGKNALSFTYTVCFVAGAFFGPFVGFLVGVGGDVLGWLVNPAGGAFNPFITLTSGLLGLIPGIVFLIVKKCSGKKCIGAKWMPLWTVISYILVWAVCTNLNTIIMFYYYISGVSTKYTALGAYYVYRIPFQTLFWACNLVLSLLLVVPIKKLLKM